MSIKTQEKFTEAVYLKKLTDVMPVKQVSGLIGISSQYINILVRDNKATMTIELAAKAVYIEKYGNENIPCVAVATFPKLAKNAVEAVVKSHGGELKFITA